MDNKFRYSDEELGEFDKILDQKIQKAEEELNYYLRQIKDCLLYTSPSPRD